MKKLFYILFATLILGVNAYSTETPKIDSDIKVESWMLELFTPDGGETFQMTGVDKTGDSYKIRLSEKQFHFNGNQYQIYVVNYGVERIEVGVHKNNYIVITNDATIFYGYTHKTLGVQKIFFNNPDAKKGFNAVEYSKQSKLLNKRVSEVLAITTIVENFPLLKRI